MQNVFRRGIVEQSCPVSFVIAFDSVVIRLREREHSLRDGRVVMQVKVAEQGVQRLRTESEINGHDGVVQPGVLRHEEMVLAVIVDIVSPTMKTALGVRGNDDLDNRKPEELIQWPLDVNRP